MIEIGDYNKIISDKNLFNQIIYTPLSDAIRLLDERQKDVELIKKIEELLDNDIPKPLKKIDKYGISTKQIATPNFDTKWFIKLTKEFGLKPFFSEYYDDKFTSNNDFKHSLGQLLINGKVNKKGHDIEEKITIVDFNKYNSKPLKKVLTLWGEPLVDFHKKLFEAYNIDTKKFIFYDASNWLEKHGGQAKKYYKSDLLLLICHGILFENFLLKGSEGNFTKNILLPAFQEVINLVGVKPLIVPISQMDIEYDSLWYSYDTKIKPYIKLK
jgi:hypothetical protein